LLGAGRSDRPAFGVEGRSLGGRGGAGRLVDRGAGRQIERSLAPASGERKRNDGQRDERQAANDSDHEAVPLDATQHSRLLLTRASPLAYLREPLGFSVALTPPFGFLVALMGASWRAS